MPAKLLESDDLTTESTEIHPSQRLPNKAWLPILQHSCDFPPEVFESVSLNLLKNPNINSSLLFRADILYDSANNALTDIQLSENEETGVRYGLREYNVQDGDFPSFEVKRTIIRRMVPRNPQLDKPIAQTCLLLGSSDDYNAELKRSLVIYIPHAANIDEIPWYHPRVQALAYMHYWNPTASCETSPGTISLHYRLYPSESLPLSSRLLRTGQHLLSTIHKHGQGQLTGYTKRVHHDQMLSQQQVQNTYTELKQRHAQRLCDRWVEKTEPSKHVFEDLGIAAFLIELWKDMYDSGNDVGEGDDHTNKHRAFPGFVDIGCGNGVVVDILLREGYSGWGFDARKRKTWDTFDVPIQAQLKEMILIPQPLFELQHDSTYPIYADGGILSEGLSSAAATTGIAVGDLPAWHNGIFPQGTFIISNHADELTPWTPLLASISSSPFLAIPCCSHNLSGLRFRAPSVFNNNSADALAPSYFAAHINKSKSIAIATASPDNEEIFSPGPEQGDLKDLNAKARAKQPSAYSSLCDWVAHLAARVGYRVEREMLRMPSTRNVGIVGRTMIKGFENETVDTRRERVSEIVLNEKADGAQWVARARGLMKGNGSGH